MSYYVKGSRIPRGDILTRMANALNTTTDYLLGNISENIHQSTQADLQHWNIYRSRAIGHWLQENNVPVIPNIRFGDERTFDVSCAGIQEFGTIAVGTHGCIKLLSDRKYFISGLGYIVGKLEPSTIVVYGAAPDRIFAPYREKGIEILQFDSEYSVTHGKAVNA